MQFKWKELTSFEKSRLCSYESLRFWKRRFISIFPYLTKSHFSKIFKLMINRSSHQWLYIPQLRINIDRTYNKPAKFCMRHLSKYRGNTLVWVACPDPSILASTNYQCSKKKKAFSSSLHLEEMKIYLFLHSSVNCEISQYLRPVAWGRLSSTPPENNDPKKCAKTSFGGEISLLIQPLSYGTSISRT